MAGRAEWHEGWGSGARCAGRRAVWGSNATSEPRALPEGFHGPGSTGAEEVEDLCQCS